MSRHERLIVNSEVPFAPEELFFSRTDERGVIRAGNEVFQRISQYSWSELVGAPHKLIRHPDMPRAVFHLMWQTIRAGQPIGAYVKNRAEDGRFYWVFANVSQVEGGYLSVRLKPLSDRLPVVADVYAEIRKMETDEGLPPDAGAERLLARLAELGFPDYSSFMAQSLVREIRARDASLGRPVDDGLARLERMVASAEALSVEAGTIGAAFEKMRTVPYNMRIKATRLGDAAGPFGVLAVNHGALSTEIRGGVEKLVASLHEVCRRVNEGLYLAGTARLQSEIVATFEREADESAPIDRAAEMAHLAAQRGYGTKSRVELEAIADRLRQFAEDCKLMRRVVTGLKVTRVLCKVEGGRLGHRDGGLDEIISRLDAFQGTLDRHLANVDTITEEMRSDVEAQLRRAA